MNIPPRAVAILREAVAHHKAGRLARAEAGYRQVLALAPSEPLVSDAYAQLLIQVGREADAIEVLKKAIRFGQRPLSCAALLSSTLCRLGRASEAEAVSRHILKAAPKAAAAWDALAYSLKLQGKLDEARRCHEQAVAHEPLRAESWYQRGLTLASLGMTAAALESHDRALLTDPKFFPARFGRAQCLHKANHLDEAVLEYDRYIEAAPHHHDARSYRLYALQNLEQMTPQALFEEHIAYGHSLPAPEPLDRTGRAFGDRPLRLGIISPDFRSHSCAYFIEPLLQHLDRDEFELHLYHDHYEEDVVSARFRTLAAQWHNVISLSSVALCKLIRGHEIDIMIDLAGHTGATIRLPLFARRLAPVQITYLGYPDTTGVPAMDFRFTDAIADPRGGADELHTERLVRLPGCAWTYRPPVDAPEVAPLPCLSNGKIVFGCFSSPLKYTDTILSAWATLLHRVPDSQLALKGRDFHDPTTRQRLMERLARLGAPTDRIRLMPPALGTAQHLACYAEVDIVLDTHPYAGTTTTCEALWMGRPVVTICGDRHAARVGASLLTTVGLRQLITSTLDDYVNLAAALAGDRALLRTLADGLRQNMDKSPLRNEVAQTRAFEEAVRHCWRTSMHQPTRRATSFAGAV